MVPAMLRALLAERFKLSAHTVTRAAPSYALLVGKAGSKLAPPRNSNLFNTQRDLAGIHWRQNMSLPNLAQAISNQLQSPVTDETGLTGVFWIALDFAPESLLSGPGTSARAPAVDLAPPLFVAVQEQMGSNWSRERLPSNSW